MIGAFNGTDKEAQRQMNDALAQLQTQAAPQ
jgi:hypothetical protein